MTPRTFRLYVIVKLAPQGSRQWRAAWRAYSKRRRLEGLCHLAAPAEFERAYRRKLWPFDGPKTETLGRILARQPDTTPHHTQKD